MTTADPIEALVVVTPQQLDAITALIGANKVHRAVVGENNIAAFWSKGPHIMAQIREALPGRRKAPSQSLGRTGRGYPDHPRRHGRRHP